MKVEEEVVMEGSLLVGLADMAEGECPGEVQII